jgi:AraC-like DNA-binding protein
MSAHLRAPGEHSRQAVGPNPLARALSDLLVDADRSLGDQQCGVRALLKQALALLEPDGGGRDLAEAAHRGGLVPWQARRVAALVDERLDSPLHVSDLASAVRLSNHHFTRAFKASFGQTPYAYVLSRRMERAKALMVDGAEPLSQIALACGLSDQAHLSRLFRRIVGVSPNAWRRQHGPGRPHPVQIHNG